MSGEDRGKYLREVAVKDEMQFGLTEKLSNGGFNFHYEVQEKRLEGNNITHFCIADLEKMYYIGASEKECLVRTV